jgi:hypothetical protein
MHFTIQFIYVYSSLSQETLIVTLNNITQMAFVIHMQCVYCNVGQYNIQFPKCWASFPIEVSRRCKNQAALS